MRFEIHKSTAVYAIVLILTLSVVYSLDVNNAATGLAISTAKDLDMKINSISPAVPKYMDKRITVTFTATGSETTGMKNIFFRFALEYPRGKKIGYTAFIPSSTLQKGPVSKTFLWSLDQRGTYKLTASVDPNNSIKEANEQNNQDSVIFKV